jgi:hypothetical protein
MSKIVEFGKKTQGILGINLKLLLLFLEIRDSYFPSTVPPIPPTPKAPPITAFLFTLKATTKALAIASRVFWCKTTQTTPF